MAKLNLGLIGMSEGNGHPFSWSAIINGYCPEHLSKCGYSSIHEYMLANQAQDVGFEYAAVTSVYSQDTNISKKIARCSKIDNVADNLTELSRTIDALLLARDDAENHFLFAKEFLRLEIPTFFDKPIALSVKDLDTIFAAAKNPKKIFSCSALRFSSEILLNAEERKKIGKLREINGKTPKSWDKYAVHLIDPLFHMCGRSGYASVQKVISNRHHKLIKIGWSTGLLSSVESDEAYYGPIVFSYVGDKGVVHKPFFDSYNAFRKSLVYFCQRIKNKAFFDEYNRLRYIVDLIEKGR